MCFLTLEDFADRIEVTVFPRAFYQSAPILSQDTPVVVQGHIDLTDDTPKILAEKIYPIEEYKPEYYLTITQELDKKETYDALWDIFARHPGEHAVYLQTHGRWRRASESCWLRDGKDTRSELAAVLGGGNVQRR